MADSPARRLRRRLRTIPRLFGFAIVLVALAPALWIAAAAVDAARFVAKRTPAMAARVLAFAYVYAGGEVFGIFWLLVVGDDVDKVYGIQLWWTGVLWRTVSRLFRLELVVDGGDVVGAGAVVLIRHSSIIDALLPPVLFTKTHGVRLRYLVKRELLEDPCLDIAGNRLPNHFVGRNSADTDADVVAIRALAAGCAKNESLLVYPEGTRFTDQKRARALADLDARAPALAPLARAMTHVLPPKPAGASALFDGAPAADAIFVAHAGLEGFAHVADIFSGALVGRTVRVKMWRVARAAIPDAADARTRWLYAEWQKVDAWVAAGA